MPSSGERRIEVQRSNYNVVSTEFDNMRDRLDAAMRRAEEEMDRLRREFETSGPAGWMGARYNEPYLANVKSPLIRDVSDGKTLRLRFDVSEYGPEEITVKTVDDRLLVRCVHEEKEDNRSVFREYNQEFRLPRGTNPDNITSTLSVDGVLTVEAPLIPIPQQSLPFTITQ